MLDGPAVPVPPEGLVVSGGLVFSVAELDGPGGFDVLVVLAVEDEGPGGLVVPGVKDGLAVLSVP